MALPSLRLFHELLDALVTLHESCMVITVHSLRSFHRLLRILLPEIVLRSGNQAVTIDVQSVEKVSTLYFRHTVQSLLNQKDVPLIFLRNA